MSLLSTFSNSQGQIPKPEEKQETPKIEPSDFEEIAKFIERGLCGNFLPLPWNLKYDSILSSVDLRELVSQVREGYVQGNYPCNWVIRFLGPGRLQASEN